MRRPRLRLRGERLLTGGKKQGLLSAMHNRSTMFLGTALLCLAVGCNKPADSSASAAPPSAPPASTTAQPAVAAVAPTQAAATAPLAAQPAAAAPSASPGTGKFGAPLSAAGPVLTASAVMAEAGKYDDKDLKLSGTVSGACQKKGCWMTLGSGEAGAQTIRVTFKDYGFFVPKDCLGKKAVVEGHFKVTTMSVAEAQHYAEDAAKEGAPVKKVTEPQKTYAMVATGVELL